MANSPLNSVQPELGGNPDWDRPRLADLLTLSPIDGGDLTSKHVEINGNGTIFGGQLIGQAICAAAHDIPDGLSAHSLQLNFLAPGLTTEDLRFHVTRLLSGRSFIVQHVLCNQANRTVFSAHVSFHRGEYGPEHATPMPSDMPAPESLPTLHELVIDHADALKLSDTARARIGYSRHLEMRPVNGRSFLLERQAEGRFQYWIRTRDTLPERPVLHQAALGYLSDYWFPITALTPHLDIKINTGLYVASLNHTIWFHESHRADEWLLIDAHSQRTIQGRGLTQGLIYTRNGRAVATIMQETLFRGWPQSLGPAASQP